MRHLAYLLTAVLALGACATADDDLDDAEAETATGQEVSGSLVGLYSTSASLTLANGDIANLELRAGGTYVRMRCYHAGCAQQAPETDHYDTYTSSSGKTYVRFYSFEILWNAAHDDREEKRVVADVYEVQKTSTTIKLRKSYSSRWVTLRRTTAKTLCTSDGGSWSSSACACPGGGGGWSNDGYVVFAPGAGGCVMAAGANEDACDTTDGMWTDDDATPLGVYCRCQKGTYLTNDGCDDI